VERCTDVGELGLRRREDKIRQREYKNKKWRGRKKEGEDEEKERKINEGSALTIST
jgi:hypothetical protein